MVPLLFRVPWLVLWPWEVAGLRLESRLFRELQRGLRGRRTSVMPEGLRGRVDEGQLLVSVD